ncbi:MAG: dihydroorotate dehydrogenase electron transfer subunit [Melioribacteraceae bacterium]|nr:dihydroorotate dehydrogenase electron transfer subunit [Melioribacteraceae bacterium]
MLIQDVLIKSNNRIADNTYLIETELPDLNTPLKPGQFFNIQVTSNSFPLLRRPFSISDVGETSLYFMYKQIGEGTKIMSEKTKGDTLNLLGPLGNSFLIDDKCDHAIFIGGGIGIAPFPFLIKDIKKNQEYSVLFGVRNKTEVHNYGLNNISYSSDDGSIGIKGNVLDLLKNKLEELKDKKIQIFACGPNPMFRALKEFISDKNIDCFVSMESVMACGFGICQGCPIEHKNDEKYHLICKDGPIFNINDIVI